MPFYMQKINPAKMAYIKCMNEMKMKKNRRHNGNDTAMQLLETGTELNQIKLLSE